MRRQSAGSVEARLARLEDQVASVQRTLSQAEIRARQQAAMPIRLAVTAVDPDDDSYPSAGNTVYLKFVDATFAETAGDQTVDKHERTENAKALGRTLSGSLPTEGTLCAVLRVGGRWWILDAGAATVIVKGRLNASLTSTGTGIIEQIVIGTPPEEVDDEINLTNANTQFAGSTDWKFCAVRTADGTYELLWVACPEEE